MPELDYQISGKAVSPFICFVFVTIIYNMTIQLRINRSNICNNDYASAVSHNILSYGEWQKHSYFDIL